MLGREWRTVFPAKTPIQYKCLFQQRRTHLHHVRLHGPVGEKTDVYRQVGRFSGSSASCGHGQRRKFSACWASTSPRSSQLLEKTLQHTSRQYSTGSTVCMVSCIDKETGLVKETHVERVYFDQAWWNENSKKVQRFYLNASLPELNCLSKESGQKRRCANLNFVLNKGRQEGFGAEEKWVPEWELNGGLHLKKGGSAPGPGEPTPAQQNACEHGRWGHLCKECKAS